ncbi:MAG: hypothetical protein ACXVCY_14560 [Pseudobdellovibrionaceae bacterium]
MKEQEGTRRKDGRKKEERRKKEEEMGRDGKENRKNLNHFETIQRMKMVLLIIYIIGRVTNRLMNTICKPLKHNMLVKKLF